MLSYYGPPVEVVFLHFLLAFGSLALHQQRLLVVYLLQVELDSVGGEGRRVELGFRVCAEFVFYSVFEYVCVLNFAFL